MSRTDRTKRRDLVVEDDLKPGEKLDKKHQRAIVRDGDATTMLENGDGKMFDTQAGKKEAKHQAKKDYRALKKKQEREALLEASAGFENKMNSRLISNRAILMIISSVIESYPDMRFHQILQNLNIEEIDRDQWNDESSDTLKAALDAFARLK